MQHPKCCTKNLTVFKFDPTSSNMLQHMATGWPNVYNMLCPTMLQDVALKCCERLVRPLACEQALRWGLAANSEASSERFGEGVTPAPNLSRLASLAPENLVRDPNGERSRRLNFALCFQLFGESFFRLFLFFKIDFF